MYIFLSFSVQVPVDVCLSVCLSVWPSAVARSLTVTHDSAWRIQNLSSRHELRQWLVLGNLQNYNKNDHSRSYSVRHGLIDNLDHTTEDDWSRNPIKYDVNIAFNCSATIRKLIKLICVALYRFFGPMRKLIVLNINIKVPSGLPSRISTCTEQLCLF